MIFMVNLDFLANVYYGNTVGSWSLSLIIILIVVLVTKILYYEIGKIVKKATSKTKTNLDDILVDMLEEPLIFTIALVGIWFSLKRLVLPFTLMGWITNSYQALIVVMVAWFATRFFEALYVEYLVPLSAKTESKLDDELLPIIRKGFKIIVWTLAIIIGLNNAGYNVGALLAGLGIGGLALAFAAKDTLSNIFGGFTIFADKPFKLKDRVKIIGFDGTVTDIGLRSTRLKTLEGRVITIPNSKFSENAVENVSAEPNRKVVLNLGLTYDTTPAKMKKAMALLKDIIVKNKETTEDSLISFNAFNDFSMNILFIYYIKKGSNILQTQTDINMQILDLFNKNNLNFAFPTQTIYTKK